MDDTLSKTSAGQTSTVTNKSPSFRVVGGTHVVDGCNTLTDENVKHSKKKTHVTTPSWSKDTSEWGLKKPSDTYLGITYHFIDSDWEIRSVTVDCEKMTGLTTMDDLKLGLV